MVRRTGWQYVGVLPMLMLTLFSGTVRADIYKFVDSHGRVFLTDKPPHPGYKILVRTWKGWVEKSYDYRKFKRNQEHYRPAIARVASRYHLPNALIHAVVTTESGYDTNAVSRAGAVGLMQLMPATAYRYGVSNRRDPLANLNAGTRYLRDLLGRFNNNLVLAIAAYNAGEKAVRKYRNQVPPFRETRHYVDKVLQYYRQYRKSL